jgi:hypothetical protein
MKYLASGLVGLAAFSTPALAQGFFTSPIGLAEHEGNGISAVNFGTYAGSRMQFLDGNQKGTARPNLKSIRLRRDSYQPPNTTAGARTIDLGIVMAHTNQAAPSTTFATNYLNNQSTQVYTVKTTNLPDLTAQPVTPAPWSITLLFDAMFSYDGVNDLLWEVTGANNSAPSTYYLDTATNGSIAGGGSGGFQYNGWTACIVPPNTAQFDIIASTFGTDAANLTSVRWYAQRGPVSSPGALGLGLNDPNLVGPFCAPLRVTPLIAIPVMTDASGNIGSSAAPILVSFPFPGSATFRLHAQFAAVDVPNLRLYLSDATAHTLSAYSPPTTRACTAIRNTTSATATTGSSSTFCIVARFDS